MNQTINHNILIIFNNFKFFANSAVRLGLILMLGVSMSACSESWKEEVLLHDGSKIIVKRLQSYGGRHEIGQGAPIKEQELIFTVPNTNKTIAFKSEYSEDIGRANFKLLALHILNGASYIVTVPNLCLSYNKWGRPNPPYVLFKYDGTVWQRIALSELPAEFKTLNLVIESKGNAKEIDKYSVVSAETVKSLNSELTQPEYKTILREPYAGAAGSCEPMVHYKCGWFGSNPDGTFNKEFADRMCNKLFKGK